jgi:hypothetical protein
MSFIFKDAEAVRTQIEALKVLYPEITEDADLLADTLEGETDLDRVLSRLVDFVMEAETMAEAVKARKADMAERQKRLENQGESGRKIIQRLMESANQQKIILPEATISITKPRESVDVTDIDSLPQGFFKTERKAMSREILTALKAGEEIPGASLNPGHSGLMLRTK